MNYIGKALELATERHAGQVDKGGSEYIGHPIYVSSMVTSADEKVVALLHDIVVFYTLITREITISIFH
jgi:(p)ppGpp synthase/HD superfamily hydrolase